MNKSSFLDKGILLGYCFSIDVHHRECREYIFSDGLTSYYTQSIRDSFNENRERIISDHRTEILHHIREIGKSGFEGVLDSADVKSIREDIVTRSVYPNSWRYLSDYYNDLDSPSIRQIHMELREIAREIEKNAHERLSDIEERVTFWTRTEDYPTVQTALEEIRESKEEDLWVCVDAHDLAENIEGHTELATTDFNDFIRHGRRELIIKNTSLDDVVGVGVTT